MILYWLLGRWFFVSNALLHESPPKAVFEQFQVVHHLANTNQDLLHFDVRHSKVMLWTNARFLIQCCSSQTVYTWRSLYRVISWWISFISSIHYLSLLTDLARLIYKALGFVGCAMLLLEDENGSIGFPVIEFRYEVADPVDTNKHATKSTTTAHATWRKHFGDRRCQYLHCREGAPWNNV